MLIVADGTMTIFHELRGFRGPRSGLFRHAGVLDNVACKFSTLSAWMQRIDCLTRFYIFEKWEEKTAFVSILLSEIADWLSAKCSRFLWRTWTMLLNPLWLWSWRWKHRLSTCFLREVNYYAFRSEQPHNIIDKDLFLCLSHYWLIAVYVVSKGYASHSYLGFWIIRKLVNLK